MKRILYFITVFTAAGVLFSCSKLNQPKIFSDEDSFVAFSAYTYDAPEDVEIFEIPVTLSSMSGLTATVAFSTTDSSAKKGVDFKIKGDGTLSFNRDKRTDTIRLEIIKDPNYTGDKIFFISLETAAGSGVKLGYNSTVAVYINDLDHPLTSILGSYTASADYTYGNPGNSWTMTLKKDADDDHKVWIYDIANLAAIGWADDDMMYYGIVNEDLTTITIPIGQDAVYKYSGMPVRLFGCDGTYVYEEGNVTFSISKENGISMVSDNGFYVCIVGLESGGVGLAIPNVSCVKN